jgi:hypothetical protein
VKKLGRPPTRTPENLPEGWYDLLYAAAEQGASKTEFATLLGLPKRTFDKMRENYPEFKDKCDQLSEVAQVWWERTGRKLVTGEISGSASAFIFQVKNRFPSDYREQPRADDDGNAAPVNISFEVASPVKSIKVTKGEQRA